MDLEFKTFDQLTHSALACSVTSGTSGRAQTCRHVARSAIFTKPADLVTVFSPTSSDIANYHKVVKQINQFQKFHLQPSRFMSSWYWYKEEVQLNARGHNTWYGSNAFSSLKMAFAWTGTCLRTFVTEPLVGTSFR